MHLSSTGLWCGVLDGFEVSPESIVALKHTGPHSLWFLKGKKNVKNAFGDSSFWRVCKVCHLSAAPNSTVSRCTWTKCFHWNIWDRVRFYILSSGFLWGGGFNAYFSQQFLDCVGILSLRNTPQACLMLHRLVCEHSIWVLAVFSLFIEFGFCVNLTICPVELTATHVNFSCAIVWKAAQLSYSYWSCWGCRGDCVVHYIS